MNKQELTELIATRLGVAIGDASSELEEMGDEVYFEGYFNITEFAQGLASEILGE